LETELTEEFSALELLTKKSEANESVKENNVRFDFIHK
jgi:hypothetical protein